MEELRKTIESIKSIGGFILDGILEGASNFGNKVGGFVKKLLEKVNKEAEIHSPSRLFKRETGVWVGRYHRRYGRIRQGRRQCY